MPTVGRATIDGEFDGDRIPEQVRRAGESAGEEFADSFDDKVKDGLDDTFDDVEERSGDAGDDAGEAFGENFADSSDEEMQRGHRATHEDMHDTSEREGRRSGRDFGQEFADRMDGVLSKRMKTTADRVSKVFSDDDGVRKFVDNYKGAGDATDALREKLDYLHRNGVLGDDDFVDLAGQVDDYDRAVLNSDHSTDGFIRRMQGLTDEIERGRDGRDDLNEDFDRTNRLAGESDTPMQGFIRRMQEHTQAINGGRADRERLNRNLEDLARGFEDLDGTLGDGERERRAGAGSLDDLVDSIHDSEGSDETLRDNADGLDELGDASERSGGKLNRNRRAYGEFSDVLDELITRDPNNTKLNDLRESLDRFGESSVRSGRNAKNGSAGFDELKRGVRGLRSGDGIDIDDLDRLGDSLVRLGTGAIGAGKGGKDSEDGFKKLSRGMRSLPQFDPFDNPGQLLVLLAAIAPEVAVLGAAAGGGLLILAGGVSALVLALAGYGIGFSALFGDLKKMDPAIKPAALAIRGLKDDFKDLQVEVAKELFTPAVTQQFQDFGDGAVQTIETAFTKIGPALNKVLLGVSTDLNSSGFKSDFAALFSSANEPINGIGDLFRKALGIVGRLLTEAGKPVSDFFTSVNNGADDFLKFLKSPEGHKEIQNFFNTSKDVLKTFGDAIGGIAEKLGSLVTPENIGDTKKTIEGLAGAINGLVEAGDNLGDAGPKIAGTLKFIADGIAGVAKQSAAMDANAVGGKKGGDPLGSLVDGVQSAYFTIDGFLAKLVLTFQSNLNGIVTNLRDSGGKIGTVLSDLVDPSKWSKIPGDIKALGDAINKPIENGGPFQALDAKTRAHLNNISGYLGLTGKDAKDFGLDIYTMAASAGVDLNQLDDKNLNGLIAEFGLTDANAKEFRDKFKDKMSASGLAVDQLDKDSRTSLDHISTNLGDTGTKSTAFQRVVAKAADDAGVKLDNLAGTKSFGEFERQLGLSGKAAKTDFSDKIITAANASGESLDDLPPKVQALINKYGTVPPNVDTKVDVPGADKSIGSVKDLKAKIDDLKDRIVDVRQSGAPDAADKVKTLKDRIDDLKDKIVDAKTRGTTDSRNDVQGLKGDIDKLQNKTVTITANTIRTGGSSQLQATGGIMAGGQAFTLGPRHYRRFAAGGITTGRTQFGNVIAGEAGPEAIVPLSGALGSVDRSVRALSAFARGRVVNGAAGTGAYGKQVVLSEGAVQVNSNSDGRLIAASVLDRLAIAVGG